MVITAFKTNQDLYDTHNNPCLFNSPSTLRHLSLQFEDTQYLQWPLNKRSSSSARFCFLVRGDVYFWGSMMAACLIASVRIAIIYNFFAARFVAGFTMGAIK